MLKAKLLGVLGTLLLLGCGGSRPAIEHRMPMERLWHTPAESRQAVAATHRQLYVAHASLEHTRFLLRDTRSEVAIAKAERKRARQGALIARLEKKRRAAGYLGKLADVASRQIDVSNKEEAALERKIRWLSAHAKFLEMEIPALEAQAQLAEADFELAKAKLLVERGFAAKDFKLAPFEAQVQRIKPRVSARRDAAEQARQRAQSKRKAWSPGR